jgi:transcriptional regulator with XRE-family HTH domain
MTALAKPARGTLLSTEQPAWYLGGYDYGQSVAVEEPDTTAGFTPVPMIGDSSPRSLYVDPMLLAAVSNALPSRARNVRLVITIPDAPFLRALMAPNEPTSTPSSYRPWFVRGQSTGEGVAEIAEFIRTAWRSIGAARVEETAPAELALSAVLDVSAALREARAQAGLPVQDLAALFGISRRQFYNLVSGEQNTDDGRAPRIVRVTDTIRQASLQVGGNRRRTRQLLLARLHGDSIYDAALVDDKGRVGLALERAAAAIRDGQSLLHRLPPSGRATPQEAAAVREYLRASRDDSGLPDA